MRKILILMLLIIIVSSCAKVGLLKRYELGYNDNFKEYIVNIYGNFDKCKKIKVSVNKDGKVLYFREFVGGVSDISLNIPVEKVDIGANSLNIYCDDTADAKEIEVWGFKSPILRHIYAGSYNSELVTPEIEEYMESEVFLKEYRDFIFSSEGNFIKASSLLEFLDCRTRCEILTEASVKYRSKESNLIFYENLKELLFEGSSLNLAKSLFDRNDDRVDIEVFNVLMTRPEKRIYTNFFSLFLTRPHLRNALIDYLLADRESPFFKEALLYFKYVIQKEGLEKDYTRKFAINYFLYNNAEFDFIMKLLTDGQRYKDGITLWEGIDVDDEMTKKFFANYVNLNKDVKTYYLNRIINLLEPKEEYLDALLKDSDSDFLDYKLSYLLRFENKYQEKYWNFVKSLVDKGIINNEIGNYLIKAPLDIKRYAYHKIFEFKKDFPSLSNLKDIDKDFYEARLVEFVNNKGPYYYDALKVLPEYGEKYYDLLLRAYNQEKDMVRKKEILVLIAQTGEKGYKYVFEEIFREPYNKDYQEVFVYVTREANDYYLEKILKKIDTYPTDVFISVTIGIEEGRKKIKCEDVLVPLFNKKTGVDEIIRINWVWAYCCPDDYLRFIQLSKRYIKNEQIMSEVLDGVLDVIKIFNIDIKEKGVSFAKEVYGELKTRTFKLKIAELLANIGSVKDLEFFDQLIIGENDDYYVDMINVYRDNFKNRLNIVDDKK